MVVRVAGLAYQKGFGGHFHNDNARRACCATSPAWSSPARPAATTPRRCCAPAWPPRRSTAPCRVFLEPIALYHTRDLHEPDDDGWLDPYAPPERWETEHVPIGRGRTYGDGRDLTIVTFANGVPMSLRVARRLERRGVSQPGCSTCAGWLRCRSTTCFARHRRTGRVLVVDETRRSGGRRPRAC